MAQKKYGDYSKAKGASADESKKKQYASLSELESRMEQNVKAKNESLSEIEKRLDYVANDPLYKLAEEVSMFGGDVERRYNSYRDNPAEGIADARKAGALSFRADKLRGQYGDEAADNLIQYMQDVLDYGKSSREYYGQFGSLERYNEYLQAEKDRDAMYDYDVAAGKKEADELKAVLDQFKKAQHNIALADTASTYAPGGQLLRDNKAHFESELAKLQQQYGSYEDLLSQWTEKNAYINQAERMQTGARLRDTAVNAEDFATGKEYAGGDTNHFGVSYRDVIYHAVNHQPVNYSVGMLTKDEADRINAVRKLTKEEQSIYNYYYNTQGFDAAEQYLDSIMESLNARYGEDIRQSMPDSDLLRIAYGIPAGLDQFHSGMQSIGNAILGRDSYRPTSSTQFAAQGIREDLAGGVQLPEFLGGDSLGQVAYDAVSTTANMAPSILTSYAIGMINPALGTKVGRLMMGASAAGSAYQEKINLGYSPEQAKKYGVMVGASEVLLEKLLGGISKLGGGMLTNTAIKGLDKIDNVLARVAKSTGGKILMNAGSEALEEGLQSIIEPYMWKAVSGEEVTVDMEEALYSALLGFITGGMFEGVDAGTQAITRNVQDRNAGKTIQGVEGGTDRLMELAKEMAASERVAKQTAKAEAKPSAKNIGKLYRSITEADGGKSQSVRDFESSIASGSFKTAAEPSRESPDGTTGVEESKVTPTAEVTAESLPEVSETSAPITEVSVENGKLTLKTADGDMDTSNAVYSSQEEALVYGAVDQVSDIIDTTTANKLSKHLLKLGEVNSDVYTRAIAQAYTYGYSGYSRTALANAPLAYGLTEKQRNVAYGCGEQYRKAKAAADQAKVQAKGKPKTQTKGKVHFEGEAVTKRQRTSLKALEKVAEIMGVQIYVFESKVKGGKRVGENGSYDPNTGSIKIDLYAGQNGEGTMLFTAAHELTHMIQQWSPEKYRILSDFLLEQYGEKGVDVDALVQAQQAKAKRNGQTLTYEQAHAEVIADSMEIMLADGKVLEKLVQLKQKDETLFGKIKKFISELAAKIRKVYEGLSPDSAEGRYVAEMKDAAEKLQELFADALVDASDNYQSSLTPGEEGVIVNESGEPVAHATADGTVQLSMRTYEEDGRKAFRDYLQKCVSSKKITKEEMDEMLDGIEEIYKVCKDFKDKYAPFSTWSDAAVVRDTHGKPVFSVVTPNGDYKMNMDFSLVCKKRRTLDAVFNEMAKRGIIDDFELGQKSVVKINEIIRKYGLETACALCFVDAKRFRQASMADSFTRLYNELVESLVPEDQRGSIDHFNFSGYETIKKVEDGIHKWDASTLDFSHLDEVMKNYGKGTVEYKAAKYIKSHAEGRRLLLRGDFMSSQGFDAVKTQNKDILKLYNSKKGTGGPKAAFGDVQYMNEIIKKARTWTPEKAYAVGGIRIQSFSDYVPRMVFDYVQMIYDLAATKLPAHAYTKETLFAKQFGLTGVKINMSLIPAIADGGISPGLDANGNYVWAGESFDFEAAKQIQNAEGYTENCGTICVGVSDRHIRKLLSDPDIRMVIPYHKSGLNPIVAHMNKIAEFTDYTNKQNTTVKETGSKAEKHFDFNAALHKMGKNADPRAVIQQYFDWCDDNGYEPKFAEFRDHPNYYKLIEDFTLFDNDGNYVSQREVRAVFPKDTDAFGSMKELIQEGLEEDAVVEGKRDKNLFAIVDEIERTIPKTEAEIAEEQVEQADRDLEKELRSDKNVQHSFRNADDTSTRGLLASALENITKDDIELKKLQEYQRNISEMDAQQQKLAELNAQIKELSFAKGKRDTAKIRALRDEAIKTTNRIQIYDSKLLRLEAAKPLQDVLSRERKRIAEKAKAKTAEAVKAERQKAEVRQSEILRDFRETKAALQGAKSDTAIMEKEFLRIAKEYEKLVAKTAVKAGKDAEAIGSLKDALREETKKHREDQKLWEAEFNRLMREYDSAGRSIAKLEQKIEQQKAMAARKVEDRKKSAVRQKIKAFKEKLEESLLKPSDRRYVPAGLVNAMVEVCNLIDTDTDLYKKDGSINKAQERRDQTKLKLLDLKNEYEKLKTQDDGYGGEFDEIINSYLDELVGKFENRTLAEMSLDELTEMYEILRSIDETLRDARKLIGWGDALGVYEAGEAIIAEQAEISKALKKGKRNAAQKSRDAMLNYSLSPVRNVERMSGYLQDSALLKLFKKLEQGVRKKNKFVMDAYKSFEGLTSGKEYDAAVYKEFGKQYMDVKGRTFRVSKMQMMQAILSYERERANGLRHVSESGFTFADMKILQKGKLKDAVSEEHAHRVPAAADMANEFAEALKNDKWCQQYMAQARKFFNETAKDAINETMMILKHRIVAKDKAYIPFEVDKNFVTMEISAEQNIQQTINSYGMLKEVKKGAPQPLIITGLNNVIDRHIDMVGNVYGLAVEIRNFNKVWNVRPEENAKAAPTVKAAIDGNWGEGGVKSIEQAIKDVQGPRVRERSALYSKVKSGYIGATFLLNLSVVTKQIGSLFSATSMLRMRGPVRLIGNLVYTMANSKKISAEVDKYTASAWMRRQGLSDAELHTLITEAKKPGLFKVLSKFPAVLNPSKWITAMDSAVALSLWNFAKKDVAKRTGLKGEELLKATAEFYDEVIENTQSMTDVLHRPEVQKKGDIVSEALGMFKTDLYQMAGQLEISKGRFAAKRNKDNAVALGRTLYAVLASAAWGQLMTTVFALLRYKVNQYRDEEDKDLTWESWLKRQGFAFGGDILGYFLPIFGSETVTAIENMVYGESEDLLDSVALTAINDLYDVMVMVGNSVVEGEMPKPEQWQKILTKTLQVFGIPANNILRTWNAIQLHAKDIANGEFFSFEAGAQRTAANHAHRIAEAIEDGRMSVAEGLLDDALESGKSASDIKSALGKKYREGEFSKNTVEKFLKMLGIPDEDIYWTFDAWDHSGEEDYAKYADFFAAVQTGKNLKQEIKRYEDNGVDQETLRRQISSYFKPQYTQMSVKDRANIKGYLINGYVYCGMDRAEAEAKLAYWDLVADNPGTTITESQSEKYLQYAKRAKISVEVYEQYLSGVKDISGDGKKQHIMDVINGLPLTSAQKDALYRMNGWS